VQFSQYKQPQCRHQLEHFSEDECQRLLHYLTFQLFDSRHVYKSNWINHKLWHVDVYLAIKVRSTK
jgi:hypothetical protein